MIEESIKGFFDGHCPKCRKKIGWYGTFKDRPPCPKCGHAVGAKKTEKMIDNGFIFGLVQTLYYQHKGRLAPMELSFIRNMLQQHKKRKLYNTIQTRNIQRIAAIYGEKEKSEVQTNG